MFWSTFIKILNVHALFVGNILQESLLCAHRYTYVHLHCCVVVMNKAIDSLHVCNRSGGFKTYPQILWLFSHQEVGLDSPPLKSRKACDYYSTEKAVQLLPGSLGTLHVRALRCHVKSPTTLSWSYCKEVRPHAVVGAL